MRANGARARIAHGQRVLNAWCSIASSHTAEAIAHQGVDSVTIDLQHGAIDFAACFSMMQAISTSAATPMVRVPWNEPGILTKVLDAGAYGVICPMVNSAQEARAFVSACRYPPLGMRSFGPNRVTYYAGTDYARHANDEVLLLAQIENQSALAELDEILATRSLDGIYIGPADLSLSFNAPPSMVPDDANVVAAMQQSRDRALAQGRIVGIHTDGAPTALRRFAEGYHLCSLPTDMRFLVNGVRAAVEAIKGKPPA